MNQLMEDQNNHNISKLFDSYHSLDKQLSELVIIVREGFKGTHDRQDTTNGRIAKNEIRIEKLEEADRDVANNVDALLENEKSRVKNKTNNSDRFKDTLFSILDKVVWITVGAILLNGKKIFELFF